MALPDPGQNRSPGSSLPGFRRGVGLRMQDSHRPVRLGRRTRAGRAGGAGASRRPRRVRWANPIVRTGDHPSPRGDPDVAEALVSSLDAET